MRLNPNLSILMAVGLLVMISLAQLKAVASRSSCGTTALTMPIS